jgi:hypothetical protein
VATKVLGATSSTTNPTWADMSRRGGKPATNRQNYGTLLSTTKRCRDSCYEMSEEWADETEMCTEVRSGRGSSQMKYQQQYQEKYRPQD